MDIITEEENITGLIPLSALERIEGAGKIMSSFAPKAMELNALYGKYAEITDGHQKALGDTPTEDAELKAGAEYAEKAKALRARMVKIRTSTQTVHDEVKAEYLPVTRAIDMVNKKIIDTSKEAEEKLAFIVDTEKRIADARMQKKEAERVAALAPFADGNPMPGNLAGLDDATWDAVFAGWKVRHENAERLRIEEETRAKREKIGTDRKIKAAPFADYIPGFFLMDFVNITDEEFERVLSAARGEKERKEKEREEEMERLREAASRPAISVGMEVPAGSEGETKNPLRAGVPSWTTFQEETSVPVDPLELREFLSTHPQINLGQHSEINIPINQEYITPVKNYLFDSMMNAPDQATAAVIERAMQVLG